MIPATAPLVTTTTTKRFRLACGLAALGLVLWTAPAGAQRRARLSDDLAERLRAGSQTIDVIVDADQATVTELARRYNVNVRKRLGRGGVLRVTAGQLDALQADGLVDHLSGDIRIQSLVEEVSAETIGANQLWSGAGSLPKLTGRGVTVAVIDSGIDDSHPALRGKVLTAVDFTGSGSTRDGYGHGTHVAGIIAARAGRTLETSGVQGISYGASLINLRVLGDDGSGYASNVIEAIEWAIANRDRFNIGVINLSLGGPVTQPYRDDPLCAAVERAVRAGIVVVAAAGNQGRTEDGKTILGGITTPGNSPYAITVGAIDAHATPARSDDTLASYSSRGPTRYDLVIKPDLVAPGSHVVSTEAAGSYLQQLLPERHVAGGQRDGYLQLSGTSMSAGVASGAAALLLDEHRLLTPRDVKGLLMVSSEFMPSAGLIGAGSGSMNVLAAASVAIVTTHQTPGSAIRQTNRGDSSVSGQGRLKSGWGEDTIFWGTSKSDTIFWGTWNDDTIFWGTWGDDDTIFWGTWGDDDTIFWGTWGDDDTIFWGTWGDDDTIFWGTWDGDTIFWGTAAEINAATGAS